MAAFGALPQRHLIAVLISIHAARLIYVPLAVEFEVYNTIL
jgi:hypothetical protein